MLNKYFKFKVKTKDFIDNLEDIIEKLKNKKVLICGGEEGFIELDKLFNLSKKLDIIAFAKTNKQTGKELKNIKIIKPEDIKTENFDSILISDEDSEKTYGLLFYKLGLEKEDIKILFKEDIEQGRENLIYLLKHNFDKTLPKLIKKLAGKKKKHSKTLYTCHKKACTFLLFKIIIKEFKCLKKIADAYFVTAKILNISHRTLLRF